MYKLIFFVPISHVEEVKKAVFSSGGGKMGAYSQCCWQTLGQGEFFSEEGAEPFIGDALEKSRVAEYKVEIRVSEEVLESCVAALRLAHPYEEPVIDLIKIETTI